MAIKTIPLSHLEMDLAKTLNECAESGETLVVEMPNQRLLAIQPLEPQEDDALMDELLASNPRFQALVAKSKAVRGNHSVPSSREQFTSSDSWLPRYCIIGLGDLSLPKCRRRLLSVGPLGPYSTS
jgi:hypothetical protein